MFNNELMIGFSSELGYSNRVSLRINHQPEGIMSNEHKNRS